MARQAKALDTKMIKVQPWEPTRERELLWACYPVNSTCTPSHAKGRPQTKELNEQKHLKCYLDNFILAKVSVIPLQITGPAIHILEYSFRNSVV